MSNNSTSKDSWFGDIPQLWNSKKIKNLFRIKKDIAGKEGYLILSITQKGILPKNISTNEGQIASDYSKYQLVNCGDFAMNHMDLLTGWVDISQYDGVTSPDYRVFVLYDKQNNHSPYYKHLFQMCYSNRVFYGLGQGVSGLGRWRLPSDQFLNFPIPQPPLSEQQRIADYLDAQCAKIDSTIVKTQQIIEKLKAYKQSVITEAVTKGLNPDAPMKDSGIEWIGEIPEHWEVRRIKTIGSFRNGLTYTPEDVVEEGCGTLVLRSSNIKEGKIVYGDNVYVSCPIKEQFYVNHGDIVICSRNGSRDLIGKNAIFEGKDTNISFGAFMMIFRCATPKYIYYVLNSEVFSYYLGTFLTSTINQLTAGNFGNMKIVFCPDMDEQNAIVEYLNDKCAKIDEYISKKQEVIEKLTGYKKSLIFEVVTGKKEI